MASRKVIQLIHHIANMLKRPAGVHKTATINWSRISGNPIVGPCSLIRNSKLYGNIQIGDHTAIIDSNISGKVKIGRYTTLNGPSEVAAKINGVEIGNFCSIASFCTILDSNHIIDRCTTYYIFRNLINAQTRQNFIWQGSEDKDIESKGPIKVGNDVWIGAKSVILTGVTIGDGAVISANSTIVHDVPPYAVVGGTPARVIKFRFPEEVIDKLLKLSWWNWDDETIKKNRALFADSLTLEKLNNFSTSG